MGLGDRLVLAAVQVPAADSTLGPALFYATQSALQQSSHVRLVGPAAITDALRRMGRTAPTTMLPDSTAAEVAEREGARYVVSLAVSAAAPSRTLILTVLEPASRLILRTYRSSAAGPALLTGIDAVAAQLRRDLGDTPGELKATLPLPFATTPSLEALRLLADGNSAYNRARYREAAALYDGALALDSGFAMARAGRASVAYVLNNLGSGDALIARALSDADRLAPRERLLIEASAARGRNDWGRAASIHRAYLIRYPEDFDVYASLGYDLMRARLLDEARAAYDSLRAHRTPRANDFVSIASVEFLQQRFAAARAAHVAALALDPELIVRAVPNEQIGKVLLALGFADSARLVHTAMLARDSSDQARGHRLLAYVDLYDGRYASAVAHLKQAIDVNPPRPGNALSIVRDRALLASTLADLGQTTEASAQLSLAATLCVTRSLPPQALLWTGKPLARLGDTIMARTLFDSARVRTREGDAEERAATSAFEAELLMATGRADAALAPARRAVELFPLPTLSETEAVALERTGKLQEALAAFALLEGQLPTALGNEGQQSARLAPLAMARIQAQLGHAREARQALGQFMERWPGADANLPFVTTLRARLTTASP